MMLHELMRLCCVVYAEPPELCGGRLAVLCNSATLYSGAERAGSLPRSIMRLPDFSARWGHKRGKLRLS